MPFNPIENQKIKWHKVPSKRSKMRKNPKVLPEKMSRHCCCAIFAAKKWEPGHQQKWALLSPPPHSHSRCSTRQILAMYSRFIVSCIVKTHTAVPLEIVNLVNPWSTVEPRREKPIVKAVRKRDSSMRRRPPGSGDPRASSLTVFTIDFLQFEAHFSRSGRVLASLLISRVYWHQYHSLRTI